MSGRKGSVCRGRAARGRGDPGARAFRDGVETGRSIELGGLLFAKDEVVAELGARKQAEAFPYRFRFAFDDFAGRRAS